MAKPMPIDPAGRRVDGGIHPDHLAAHVEQRAAGIAAVDGGIGLDEVVERPLADVPPAGGDDAGGDRAAKAEGIADGDHPIAYLGGVGIAELHGGQRPVGPHPQQGEIGARIGAHHLGAQGGVVLQDDVDLLRPVDDVVVRHDEAGGVDDEARTQ